MPQLRRGKTKVTLEASIDSALLAVEVYNKPRTAFRTEAYISLMVMAWTRLFHAHFNTTIGDRYYHKDRNGRYHLVDGERKAWELSQCIKEYGALSEPVVRNLEFFIKLRNRIEHRLIDKREVDVFIFGECQALLYNYENLLIQLFGSQYAINESLVYSLQFSHLRTARQQVANRAALSKDLADVMTYVENFRTGLSQEIYDSQEYSIKLIQIPKISNTNRADAAIEFVRWNDLSSEDRTIYEQVTVLIKDKKIHVPAVNVGGLRPSSVVERANAHLPRQVLSQNLHTTLYKLFRIRPPNGADDPFATQPEFCLYDKTHNDYVYQEAWVEFLVNFIQASGITPAELRAKERLGEFLDVEAYRI